MQRAKYQLCENGRLMHAGGGVRNLETVIRSVLAN